MKLIQKSFPVKRISPMDQHFFFGYYDLQPFSGRHHLAHKVEFTDHLNKMKDAAQIGILDIDTEKFEVLDETYAWCFQQGAMLQWNPAAPNDEIIYNARVGTDFVGVIMNIHTGAKRYLEKPVSNVSPKGDYALSINFHRLYNFRAGYGYPSLGDPFFFENHSDKDGIHLVDLKTGKAKLIISLQQLWDFCGCQKWFGRDRKLVVNHITFNTDGTRFMFILRNFPDPGKRHDNMLVTANTDGSDMYILSDWGMQSHYHWRDPDHLIFWSDGKELDCVRGSSNMYMLKDKTHEGELIGDGVFFTDNHMSFSPDRKILMNDTYPVINGTQSLRFANFEKDVNLEIGRFHSMIDFREHWCCDLHPCWSPDGKMASFDSTHEGFRGIYMVDMEPILEFFDKL